MPRFIWHWGKEHHTCIVQIYTFNTWKRWNSVVNKSQYSLLRKDTITWDQDLSLFDSDVHLWASRIFLSHSCIYGHLRLKGKLTGVIDTHSSWSTFIGDQLLTFFQCKRQTSRHLLGCVLLKCNMLFRECTRNSPPSSVWQTAA